MEIAFQPAYAMPRYTSELTTLPAFQDQAVPQPNKPSAATASGPQAVAKYRPYWMMRYRMKPLTVGYPDEWDFVRRNGSPGTIGFYDEYRQIAFPATDASLGQLHIGVASPRPPQPQTFGQPQMRFVLLEVHPDGREEPLYEEVFLRPAQMTSYRFTAYEPLVELDSTAIVVARLQIVEYSFALETLVLYANLFLK
jgi:hypothetical protein